jgi:hypothetical protein
VVVGKLGYHKAHVARRWCVRQDRIRPLWVSAYSPELNLIEAVWRHLQDKIANHRGWAELPDLGHATGVPLDRLMARFHRAEDGGTRLVHDFRQPA